MNYSNRTLQADIDHLAFCFAKHLQAEAGKRKIVYISGPITNGMRRIRLRANGIDDRHDDFHAHLYRKVIAPNSKRFHQVIAKYKNDVVRANCLFINPTTIMMPEWTQEDYRFFWGRVVEYAVESIIFLKDWQYSDGAAYEFLVGIRTYKPLFDERNGILTGEKGCELIAQAIDRLRNTTSDISFINSVWHELQGFLYNSVSTESPASVTESHHHYKDAILHTLAQRANVAQFVSFAPAKKRSLTQRYSYIQGFTPNYRFTSTRDAINALLHHSPDGTVNIRSFRPEQAKGEPLLYGLNDAEDIIQKLKVIAEEGKYVIVNETVDVKDGGVSGVAIGNVIEFAPFDTPKAVEKPGICSLQRQIGTELLHLVYGFRPAIDYRDSIRVEFSTHPKRRGYNHDYTIIWELEEVGKTEHNPTNTWPNRFSKMLGDKAFGLLLASVYHLPVPFTTVINRTIAPFSFGQHTGLHETYLRPCPSISEPGKYTTYAGWHDPFTLIMQEDTAAPDYHIPAIVSQEAVEAVYSGRLIPHADGTPFIQGVQGSGGQFMVGEKAPEEILPGSVISAVNDLYDNACQHFGPVDLEWVYDGHIAWLLQIHKGQTVAMSKESNVVVPGDVESYIRFDISRGLEELRTIVRDIQQDRVGIILEGDVGITSHFGDILRAASIPSKIEHK